MTRQLLIKLPLVCLALAALLSPAQGGTPFMDVTVFDATQKIVFKQAIQVNATFATGSLRAGKYVVQFNSKSAALRNAQYLAVVSAGKKKVIAAAVPGEKFMAGGAAMKIAVEAGTQITGQVATESVVTGRGGPTFRVVDGKRYLWVSARTGSNLAGQWVEETLAPARNVTVWSADEFQKKIDRAGEGSMLTNHASYLSSSGGGY